MRLLIYIAFLVTFFFDDDLKEMRNLYQIASKSEEYVNSLKALSLKQNNLGQPLKTAYFGAAEMVSAQYKLLPNKKIATFNNGKKILDQALKSDSLNVEIRYLRFTIQSNCPSFLGYNKNIESDKQFIIKNLGVLKTKDKDLYVKIYTYLLTQSKLDAGEKKMLEG
jgi:hypothetical protein